VLDVKWVAYMPVKSNEVTKCQQVSILTHCKPIEERRKKKRQEREDGNLQSIHFLNVEEFLRFQRWNLNRIVLVFQFLNKVLREAYWIVKTCKVYTRFSANWSHKREMAVKRKDLDLKSKEMIGVKCEKKYLGEIWDPHTCELLCGFRGNVRGFWLVFCFLCTRAPSSFSTRGENSIMGHDSHGFSPVYPKKYSQLLSLKSVYVFSERGCFARSLVSIDMMYLYLLQIFSGENLEPRK